MNVVTDPSLTGKIDSSRGRVTIEGSFNEFNRGDNRARALAVDHAKEAWHFGAPSVGNESEILPVGQKSATPIAGTRIKPHAYLANKSDQEILDMDPLSDPGLRKISEASRLAAAQGSGGAGNFGATRVRQTIDIIDTRAI